MSTIIIAIVGASGSGKTTISRTMSKFGFPDVVSFTTRPMRPGETQGVEHKFVSEKDADVILSTSMPLAMTMIAGYRYFALYAQIAGAEFCTYVIDEAGLQRLRASEAEVNGRFPNTIKLLTIHVERDPAVIAATIDPERVARDNERTPLEESEYDIRIVNDAPNTFELEYWTRNFAVTLGSVLPLHHCTARQVVLHTSAPDILTMINQLNPKYDVVK